MRRVIHGLAVIMTIGLKEVDSAYNRDLVGSGLESESTIADHLYTRAILCILCKCL